MSENLLTFLKKEGHIVYGSVFPAKVIQNFMEIEVPDIGTKRQFDAAALQELDAVTYVRNNLLGLGMYIKHEKDHYRILLPSENVGKIYGYLQEAKRKNAKAQKLLASTPLKATMRDNDTLRTRILMQADDLKKSQARSRLSKT